MLHGVEAVAAVGKPLLITCGAEDCEADHSVYEPSKLLLVMEGSVTEDMPDHLEDSVEEAVKNGTLVRGDSLTFPTLLGYWWDITYATHKQN